MTTLPQAKEEPVISPDWSKAVHNNMLSANEGNSPRNQKEPFNFKWFLGVVLVVLFLLMMNTVSKGMNG